MGDHAEDSIQGDMEASEFAERFGFEDEFMEQPEDFAQSSPGQSTGFGCRNMMEVFNRQAQEIVNEDDDDFDWEEVDDDEDDPDVDDEWEEEDDFDDDSDWLDDDEEDDFEEEDDED